MLLNRAISSKKFVLCLLALLGLSAAAFAADGADQPRAMLSPSLHPAAETAFVPSLDELPAVPIDPAWYATAGARKGMSGQADTRTELLIAPDTAVLSRGLWRVWPSILAAHQEATALVEPQDIAGLNASKLLLVIPSGALAGTNQSGFFKAGLAEYVRGGGTLFCLSQRRGMDFSVLPVPEGQHLEAMGWSEDAGPLFRASSLRDAHPLVRNFTKPAPLVETEGYIRTYPADAHVLLARADGFPTLLVYEYGKGQVVVSTLFTDLTSLLGSPEQDEKTLVRDLLAWSKTERRESRPAAQKETTGSARTVPSLLPAVFPLPPVRGAITRSEAMIALKLSLPGSAELKDKQVLVRTVGQEKSVTLSDHETDVSFELPVPADQRRISYAVYEKQGRSLARGSLAVPAEPNSKALPGRPFYLPGDLADYEFNGIGKGQITLQALGYMNDQIIPDKGTIKMDVPDDIPAGTYRILWVFEDTQGTTKQSSFPVDVAGYRVAVLEAAVTTSRDKGKQTGRTVFTIQSGKKISGQMHLILKRPDGSTAALAEPVLSLVEGVQAVPVTFPMDQDLSGIWELSYRFDASLPVGPALPTAPVSLDAGSVLFDRGDSAVLAISTRPFLQYEPGSATATAILLGKGSTTVQVSLDGQELSREQKELSGVAEYQVSLPKLAPGSHTLTIALSGQGPAASREHRFISGLRLPDLTVSLRAGEPAANEQGPMMPLTFTLGNEGKTASSPVGLVLFEGDPVKGGKLIATIEVPALAPGEKAIRHYEWPLYHNAGARTLTATVNKDGSPEEADRTNNRASVTVRVPELLIQTRAPKAGFSSADDISLPLSLFNLGSRPLKDLTLKTYFLGPAGKRVSSAAFPIPEIKPAAAVFLPQTLTLPAPPAGMYTLSAAVSAKTELAAASVRFPVLPTLLFTGTLENTPANAVQCRSFTINTRFKRTGNIGHTSGTARVQVFDKAQAEPLLVRTFPLAVGARSVTIENLELPPGRFLLRLAASAANDQFKLSREFTLDERELTVSGPVEAKRVEGTFPRVLALRGREGRVVEQAVADTMLQQAFDQEEVFIRMVDTEDRFRAQAMTGMFNVYLLFEPEGQISTSWLKERIEQGQGVVLIGAGTTARVIAEDLGFTFQEQPARPRTFITFTDRSPLVVTGTIPVSGKSLQVRKAGAQTVAFFGSPDEPALVIDASKKGKVVVLPLPVSHSAYEDGTMALYSLVLRRAGLFAAPETDAGGLLSGTLSVAAPGGPVGSRVFETLPAGSKVLWSNRESTVSGSMITWQLTADRDPQKLLYLYQPNANEQGSRSAELFYECGGKYVTQGRIE